MVTYMRFLEQFDSRCEAGDLSPFWVGPGQPPPAVPRLSPIPALDGGGLSFLAWETQASVTCLVGRLGKKC